MISTSIVIHGTPDLLPKVKELGLTWTYSNQHGQNEIDFFVDDIPYEIVDGTYQDPDEQLCEFYELDYNKVNMIEMA